MKETILIADNNPNTRDAISTLLKYRIEEYKLINALGPINFFEKIKDPGVKIVLLDWDFFNSQTREIVILLKKVYPDISLVIISMEKKDKKESLKAGGDAFFLKNDPPEDLINILKKTNYENRKTKNKGKD